MIVSILGMSGMDEKKESKTTAFYNCEKLGKKSGDYHNATDMLLKNYDDKFYFLGTKKAIDFQKKLLDIPQNVEFIEIEDNSLEDIFEKVYDLLKQSDKEDVILDITHGFRHQPISAIFSATLHRFLNKKNLKIIFAKQIVEYKEYEYIYLDNYLDIVQLSLLLTGFIRTLNFVESIDIEGFETLSFEKFSKALLSNNFFALEKSYKNLTATLQRAKKDHRFDHLKDLFEEIEETLSVFRGFKNLPIYKKYLIVARLMAEKNYVLLSITYLFEAVRYYVSEKFYEKKLVSKRYWENNNRYTINQNIISFVTQKSLLNYTKNYYDKKDPSLYKQNAELFEKIEREYIKLKDLRNKLTHINSQENMEGIEKQLKVQLDAISDIIEKDILAQMKI